MNISTTYQGLTVLIAEDIALMRRRAMNVLVTGGAGFIGLHLVQQLLDQGCHVRALDNFASGSRESLARLAPPVTVIEGDVRDGDTLRAVAQGIDTIFHLAALVSVAQSVESPLETFDVNLMGTLRLLEAARSAGVRRVILASTCAVYGGTTSLPIAEGCAPAPLSPYAASKLAAEQALQLYTRLHGLETVALRFFNVYGPRQDPASPYAAVVPRVIAALHAGRRPLIFGDGLQTRDFIYVGDVVASLWAAATLPEVSGSVFNVGRGEETSVRALVTMISELLGVTTEPDVRPARAGEVRRSYADVAVFATAGFRASTALRKGLALTIEAFAHDRNKNTRYHDSALVKELPC